MCRRALNELGHVVKMAIILPPVNNRPTCVHVCMLNPELLLFISLLSDNPSFVKNVPPMCLERDGNNLTSPK